MTDLGKWHPYTASNDLRLITGWLTGVSIGSVLVMVTGMTLWRSPKVTMRVLPNWRWAIGLVLPCVPALLLLRSGSSLVYYPVSMLLIASAITAFAALSTCAIVMLRNQDNRYDDFRPGRSPGGCRGRNRGRASAGAGWGSVLARSRATLAVTVVGRTLSAC